MGDTYQSKYQQVFHENANCIVINDAQFHGSVTLNAGSKKGVPPTSQRVKEAIERISEEGLLTEGTLWWAIYRVLTMPEFGYPTNRPDFCKTMANLELQVTQVCMYENWRKVTIPRLTSSPDNWSSIDNLTEAESRQCRVALRLLNLLRS